MTDNTTTNKMNSFKKRENKEEMKKQIFTFALMIFFTFIAFAAVMMGASAHLVIPIILILAIVQVGFQFFYFMHLKDEGHEVPTGLILSGIFVTFLVILTFTTIIWW